MRAFQEKKGNPGSLIYQNVTFRYCGCTSAQELLADLELDEVEQLGVVHGVALVEVNHDEGNVDLVGEKNVLAGLGHRAVSGGDDEDRAVHLRRARDHVLDVVGVPGAVHVGVVTRSGLVLDVGDRVVIPRSGSSGALSIVSKARYSPVLQGEVLRDRRGQRRLAVVDVADRPDIDVGLGALELLLGHLGRGSCCSARSSDRPADS